MRDEVRISCPKHGEVLFSGTDDLGTVVRRYCPQCEMEARQQHLQGSSPYPLQGTSPSVIVELNRGD